MKESTAENSTAVKGMAEKQTRLLGPLEHHILDTLWSNGGVSGKEVYAEIKKSRCIALTTVLTVLERLTRKGIVTKRKGRSVYLFTPSYGRDEFARRASHSLFRDIIEISASGATTSFIDILALSDPDELNRAAALIETKVQELKRAKS